MRIYRSLLVGMLVATLHVEASSIKRFYVSPSGNDQASGSWWRPFATFTRAQQAVASFKSEVPAEEIERIEVCFSGGTYRLQQPIRLLPEHGGTATYPVIYRARSSKPPVFIGGRVITGWSCNKNGIWQTTIPEVKKGEWQFAQLFVNGERRFRPRLPKQGYYTTTNDFDAVENVGINGFYYKEDCLDPNWANLSDIEFHTLHIWSASRVRSASIDAQKKLVRFLKTRQYNAYWGSYKGPKWDPNGSCRFWAENVKEALSEPGEWYLDRPTGILSYIPLPNEDLETACIEAPTLSQLLIISGEEHRPVRNTHIKGLVFKQSLWITPEEGNFVPQSEVNIPAAAEITYAQQVTLQRCVFTQLSGYSIAFGPGAHSNTVDACIMSDLGAGGVKIGAPYIGYSTIENPTKGHHSNNVLEDMQKTSAITVSNCSIIGGGRIHPAAHGVWIGHSSYNRILHNEIGDLYYTAISIGWTWGYSDPSHSHHNEIGFNHLHTIGQGVLSDMGAIYTLGVSPGTTLHDNLIHDVHAYSYGGWGLYTDQASSFIHMYNNLVYNTKTGGFDQHFGRENIIENNIFANAIQYQLQRSKDEDHLSFYIRNNLIYWDTEGVLLGSNWKSAKHGMKDGNPTQHFELGPNLYWHASGKLDIFPDKKTLSQWQADTGQDAGSLVADPLFVNPSKNDFRLKPESPAHKVGFKPFDAVGTSGPERESSLPNYPVKAVPTPYTLVPRS